MSLSRAAFRAVLLLVLCLWGLLVVGWLALHWLILPHIDEWRPQLEAQASKALGSTVRVARIEVTSGGWVPVLSLVDVTLADPAGRVALRLPKVVAAVSPQSLFTFSLRFSQLHIEGAELEVRRDAKGALHVGGFDMDGTALGEDRRAADWFFRQQEFVIRAGRLRWVDEQRDSPPLALSDVDLVVRNSLRHHDLRLDATPPADWGDRFSLRGRFSQPFIAAPGDWQRWSGTLHADLPRADVAQLHRHVTLPVELTQGLGALRFWMDLSRGQWRAATLDLALDAVRLRLRPDLPPLALAQLHGRFQADRDDDGIRLSASGLRFSTDDGVRWPASQLAFRWQQPQGLAATEAILPRARPSPPPLKGGEFSADRLDLSLLARLAGRLPLPTALLHTLAEASPEGRVEGLQARWTGPIDAPETYKVSARLRGLSVVAQAAVRSGELGRPGGRHLDVDLEATEVGGEGRVTLAEGALEFPGVFEAPLVEIKRLGARLEWQVRARPGAPPEIALSVPDLRLANADGQGEFQARWQTGDDGQPATGARWPGRLELTGRWQGLPAARLVRYLPRVVGPEALSYVTHAVRGGEVSQLNVRIKGRLEEFPSPKPAEGEFRFSAQVRDVALSYVTPEPDGRLLWPAFSQVAGEVVLDRTSLSFRNAQAQLWGLDIRGVNGQIRDLLGHSVLKIDGRVTGPLADGLRYVDASPLARLMDNALRDAVAFGPLDLRLALAVPFANPEETTVKGLITLAGNDVHLQANVPTLANARARVEFTEQGLTIRNGAAQAVGGELGFEGGTLPDGSLRFAGQGVATAEGLRAATELGPVSRLARHLSGKADYKLLVGIRHGHPEVQVSSPLLGLASSLPSPLQKSASTVLPLLFRTDLAKDLPPGASPRDTQRLELGNLLSAEVERDLATAEPRILRGALAMGAPLPSPAPGTLQAVLRLGRVNLDQWQALATELAGGPVSGGARSALEPESRPAATAPVYLPTDVDLQADELALGGRRLTQVAAKISHRSGGDGEHWRLDLQSDQAQGQVDYQPGSPTGGSGSLHARLARLAIPQADADAVDSLADAASTSVPALDIVVEDFELRGKKLGKLEVEASYRGKDGRDWRLSKFNLGLPEAQLTGTGQWSPGARRRTAIDFKLDLQDTGGLLERLGFGRVVKGGKGQITGQLAWNGTPLSPEWAQTTGRLQMALESGQFLQANPGAARLLGVLSLQSLPRRFLLDFRDVFQEGFAFDKVTADVSLADGIARTGNLRMRGVQAVVLLEGEADLRKETQDLRLFIVPDLNAGTASLAYAAINPIIGLGTFLAQEFLRKPLMEASTREFTITGGWADPHVVPVVRKANARVPDLDPPAAALPGSAPGLLPPQGPASGAILPP